MLRIYSIAAIVAVIAGMSVAWWMGRAADTALAQCSASKVVGGDIGGPFELIDSSGKTVTDTDVIKEPSLVYFGYTYCPDVCPFDVSRNADAVDLLEQKGLTVNPVFITIDPKRDTPDVISDYAENMHDRMIALTGSSEQIAAASAAYKTYYKVHDDGTDEYLVDHSTFTYLMMPGTGFAEFFRRDVTAEDMATRTACFIENA